MIPLLLSIKGLYSFQEEQRIDFTKLVSAQLFGIFGTVGSGKSTILEAISFALYNHTERLNARENRNYNMMNLKSEELLIDFEFRNYDDEVYRFVVKGKRHASDFAKVGSYQRDAYHRKAGSWIPLGSITAESILGLSYENFRRTIIIPQGQFQEFLELGDKARTDMLKELFHLEKYDFYLKTASLDKRNNEKIQYLSGQLTQYEATTPESIDQQAQAVAALAEALSASRNALAKDQATEKVQSELKKLFGELDIRRQKLSALSGQEPDIVEKEALIDRYESCVQLFKSQLSAQQETEKMLKEKQQILTVTAQELRSTEESLATDQQGFEVVDKAFRQLDHQKQQIADYKHLVTISRLSEEIVQLEKRIAAGEEKLNAESAQKKAAADKVDTVKKQIQDIRSGLPDQSQLAEIKAWFVRRKDIGRSIERIAGEKQELLQKLEAQRRSLQLPEALQDLFPLLPEEPVESHLARLESQKRLNDTKSEAILELNNHLLLQEKLEAFAHDLEDGKPCPLCGSTHHPQIMDIGNVKETRESNDEKLENVRKQNALIAQAQQLLNDHLQARSMTQQLVKASEEGLERENSSLQSHVAGFRWESFSAEDEKAFDEAFDASKAAMIRLATLEKDLETQERQLKESEANTDQFNQLLQQIRNEFTVKVTEKQTLASQLQTVGIEHASSGRDELQRQAEKLESEVISLTEKHEALSQRIAGSQQQQVVLKERVTATGDSIAEYNRQLEKLQRELESNLAASAFESVEEIKALLAKEIDTKALRAETEAFRQAFFKSKADVAELEKETEGKTFDPLIYDILVGRIASQEKAVQEQHDLHVRESAALERSREDLEKKRALLEAMEGFRRRADNLQVMKNLFKGSGFVNFISTVYLQNLCEMANVRFHKLTRQQLRLEISEGNDFMVRDYLNDGRQRSIKTLSGGQMFQAALSLALALAESIQRQHKAKQNFFFLDEGFGSQDKISLQMVFDSLKSLRDENRVIGVISHVEDLQQEIDMFLKLENDPETGSRIEESWR